MRSRGVRSALVQQLYPYSKSHAFLDNQQFDYISRLLNQALKVSGIIMHCGWLTTSCRT